MKNDRLESDKIYFVNKNDVNNDKKDDEALKQKTRKINLIMK